MQTAGRRSPDFAVEVDPVQRSDGLLLRVTPWRAFAAASLLAASLALAFACGERSRRTEQRRQDGREQTLQSVRQGTPIRYDQLEVDLGAD